MSEPTPMRPVDDGHTVVEAEVTEDGESEAGSDVADSELGDCSSEQGEPSPEGSDVNSQSGGSEVFQETADPRVQIEEEAKHDVSKSDAEVSPSVVQRMSSAYGRLSAMCSSVKQNSGPIVRSVIRTSLVPYFGVHNLLDRTYQLAMSKSVVSESLMERQIRRAYGSREGCMQKCDPERERFDDAMWYLGGNTVASFGHTLLNACMLRAASKLSEKAGLGSLPVPTISWSWGSSAAASTKGPTTEASGLPSVALTSNVSTG